MKSKDSISSAALTYSSPLDTFSIYIRNKLKNVVYDTCQVTGIQASSPQVADWWVSPHDNHVIAATSSNNTHIYLR